jgi:glycosyltransferase involved in cell wall biosynthesis
MRELKVLEVVSGLGMGGAEKALISRLNSRPNGIRTLVLNVRPQIDSLSTPTSVDLLRCEGGLVKDMFFISRVIRDFNPDIVIVRTPADVVRLATLKTLFRLQFCFIFEAHSNFVTKKRFFVGIFSLLFYGASLQLRGIIAVSNSVKDGPLCKMSIPVLVCYLGSDIRVNSSEFKELEKAKLLFLGRMVDVKRPLWLIERINNLRNQIALEKNCLTLVGDGPLLKEARKLVLNLGLGEYVNFAGQQAEVLPYLLEHSHLVSCSRNEGLPITFYEAKLAGLRIISTPSGGGAEIFSENDAVTSGFSEFEFETALAKALTDPVPPLFERIETSEASAWMSTESCGLTYYQALFTFLSGGVNS